MLREQHPSPEEEIIELENFREQIIDPALDRINRIEAMFFEEPDISIWYERVKFGIPIRNLATTFHMSRYNIRKRLACTQRKIILLRKFFSL